MKRNGLAAVLAVGTMSTASILFAWVAPAGASVQPAFAHRGGAVVNREVHAHAGLTTFEVLRGLAQVRCHSGSAEGQIVGKSDQTKITGLIFALSGCIATNNVTEKTCPVRSAKGAAGEIVSSKLLASLVEVSKLESSTGVGMALTPISAHASFLSFVVPKGAGCVPLPADRTTTIAVVGGVIAAVGRVNHEASTQPLYLEVERGAYGETSQAIQHGLGAPQLVLSSFGGIESPISSDITLSFGEGVEITS